MLQDEDIKLFRLITGEELIAERITPDSLPPHDYVKFRNPIRFMLVPSKGNPNNPTVGFAPWQEFSTDTEFTLDKAHVLAIMTPIKEFKEQYRATFSKIITPKPGLILP